MPAIALVSRGTWISCSSKSTTPATPGPFQSANGSTCFWPESAMHANQGPRFSRSRNARIAGFSPLLAFEYPRPPS